MISTETLNVYLPLIANAVGILGFPLALFLFYHEKRKERRAREYGTYDALDDKYIHFLELCLKNPDINVFEFDQHLEENSTKDLCLRKRQEQVLFTMLISILERAYLTYNEPYKKRKKRQWTGWVEYMKDYCRKETFRQQWPLLGPQFDSRFVKYMEKLIKKTDSNKDKVKKSNHLIFRIGRKK